MEWVTPEGEIVRTGSLGSGDGWFCSEGPGPSVRGIMPRHARLARRHGRLHQVRHQAGPLARAHRLGGRRHRARLPAAASPRPPGLHHRRPHLGRLGGRLLQDLRQRDRLHLPPPVQPGRRRPRPRLLAHVQRPHQDAQRRARDWPRSRRSRSSPRRCASPSRSSWRAARRPTSSCRTRSSTSILEEVGGWKVERFCEQDMAEFTNMYLKRLGPQAHQLRLGRRLHRQLDAGRHARLGQGLRARRRPPASSATRRTASWCSAAATP